MRKIRKRRMAAVMVLCVGLLSGCAGKTQTDDLVITIPEYEKITYTWRHCAGARSAIEIRTV